MMGFFLLLQVLQYKKRCGDLEQTMQEKNSEWEKQRVSVSDSAGGEISTFFPAGINSSSFLRAPRAGEQRNLKRPALRRLQQQPGGRFDSPGGRAAEVQ